MTKRPSIAIVGSGISGLGCAWALREHADVQVFEADERIGGHSNTVDIDLPDGRSIQVDTGFIVYNDHNYPNFIRLMAALDVPTIASDMSFSVNAGGAREWSSNGLGGIFAWKRNMASVPFLSMLADVLRFNRTARADLAGNAPLTGSLGSYLQARGFSGRFIDDYLSPMGACIWSTPTSRMLDFPAESFLRFFDNHRLMHASRPAWRTIAGGSRTYVSALVKAIGREKILTRTPVNRVTRAADGVVLTLGNGEQRQFDEVVLACHSDQSRRLLADADRAEQAALDLDYGPNTAWLHTDTQFMPRRKAAWASWNYKRSDEADGVCVTYWMNLLQDLPTEIPVLVTLNPPTPPESGKVWQKFSYDHPQFDTRARAAQMALPAAQGRNRVWFCGAWTSYGFHEDGLTSGLAVARAMGAHPDWTLAPGIGASRPGLENWLASRAPVAEPA